MISIIRRPLSWCLILIAFSCGSEPQSSLEIARKHLGNATDSNYPRNDCDVTAKVAFLDGVIRDTYPSVDGASIVNALKQCTRNQRVEIVARYNAEHRHNFLNVIDVKCETWTSYIISSLARSLPEFWARELNWAVKGPGTNENAIIQILTPLNNAEITQLKRKYEEIFKRDLRSDLLDDISGDFAAIVDSQLQGLRDKNNEVNRMAPSIVAETIHAEGVMGILKNRNSLFFKAITQMSFRWLRKVDNELLGLDYPIQDAINKTFSGWDSKAYSAIVTYAESKIGFFVEELKRASDADDPRPILRIMTWRFDIDLKIIEAVLWKKYKIKLRY